MNQSRVITTSQTTPYSHLAKIVQKHLNTVYQKPIPDYQKAIFTEAMELVETYNKPLILDSGCGVGESTRILAQQYPDCFILGVDQSLYRLTKGQKYQTPESNFALIRANLVDFWRLVVQTGVWVKKHYLLYPNPYPKPDQFKRRWHGHPVFPSLIQFGETVELRSNWRIYVEEFALAFAIATSSSHSPPTVQEFHPDPPLTPFERKYYHSGQTLWQVLINR